VLPVVAVEQSTLKKDLVRLHLNNLKSSWGYLNVNLGVSVCDEPEFCWWQFNCMIIGHARAHLTVHYGGVMWRVHLLLVNCRCWQRTEANFMATLQCHIRAATCLSALDASRCFAGVRANIQHALRRLLCGHWGRGRLWRGPLAVSRTGVIVLWCKPDSDKVIRADTVVAAQLTVMNGVLNASATEWRTTITSDSDWQSAAATVDDLPPRRYVCNRVLCGQ